MLNGNKSWLAFRGKKNHKEQKKKRAQDDTWTVKRMLPALKPIFLCSFVNPGKARIMWGSFCLNFLCPSGQLYVTYRMTVIMPWQKVIVVIQEVLCIKLWCTENVFTEWCHLWHRQFYMTFLLRYYICSTQLNEFLIYSNGFISLWITLQKWYCSEKEYLYSGEIYLHV